MYESARVADKGKQRNDLVHVVPTIRDACINVTVFKILKIDKSFQYLNKKGEYYSTTVENLLNETNFVSFILSNEKGFTHSDKFCPN